MELERLWMLGWTTWLSPTKIPSAKINTARMMVSGKRRQWHFRSYSNAAQAPPRMAVVVSHHWKWKCLVLHAHLVRRSPGWLRGQSGAWYWLGLCLSSRQPHSGDCSVLPVKHGPLTSAQSLRQENASLPQLFSVRTDVPSPVNLTFVTPLKPACPVGAFALSGSVGNAHSLSPPVVHCTCHALYKCICKSLLLISSSPFKNHLCFN